MASTARTYGGNGVDGVTGKVLPGYSVAQIVDARFGPNPVVDIDDDQKCALENKNELNKKDFGVKAGIDPADLKQAGWAVIFSATEKPEVLDALHEALRPLLVLRKRQAGERYQEYSWNGESAAQFLTNRNVPSTGPVDPALVPYYVLLVGDPEMIPFSFQFNLDVAYAVGRIHFDSITDYARYARSVVEAETKQVAVPKRTAFFGVAAEAETQASYAGLIQPLVGKIQTWLAPDISSQTGTEPQPPETELKSPEGWSVHPIDPALCTKAKLGTLLGKDAPALLVAATHGALYDLGDPRQPAFMGSLLCQEYQKYLNDPTSISFRDCIFAGQDVDKDGEVAGMIVVMFACFGAGYPELNEYWRHDGGSGPKPIAQTSALSGLAKALLAHPNGGALAVMGHIDRAWTTSFIDDYNYTTPSIECFNSAIKVLMAGKPIGMASEYFNQRYSQIGAQLLGYLDDASINWPVRPTAGTETDFADCWTGLYDARNYIVVGDPAVRLVTKAADEEKPTGRRVDMDKIPEPEPDAAPEPQAGASPQTQTQDSPRTEASPQTDASPQTQAAPQAQAVPAPEPQASASPQTQTQGSPQTEASPQTQAAPQAQAAPAPPTQPAGAPQTPNVSRPAGGGSQLHDYGAYDVAVAAVGNAFNGIQEALTGAFKTLTTLEVDTWTNDSLDKGTAGGTLRAKTTSTLGGNTVNVVPQVDGKVDDALWKIHLDALDRALQNRNQMVEIVLRALGLGGPSAGK